MRVPRDNLLPEPGSQPDETSMAMARAVREEQLGVLRKITSPEEESLASSRMMKEFIERKRNIEDDPEVTKYPSRIIEPGERGGDRERGPSHSPRETYRTQLDERFDPEGSDYDIARARASGMKGAEGAPPYKDHLGSVVKASPEEKQKHGLPDESYLLLKGRGHESWDQAVEAERERGFKVIKRGSRYYSVPE